MHVDHLKISAAAAMAFPHAVVCRASFCSVQAELTLLHPSYTHPQAVFAMSKLEAGCLYSKRSRRLCTSSVTLRQGHSADIHKQKNVETLFLLGMWKGRI